MTRTSLPAAIAEVAGRDPVLAHLGALLRLVIALPGQEDLQVQARVVFTIGAGETGVAFEEISDNDRDRVSRVVLDCLYGLVKAPGH